MDLNLTLVRLIAVLESERALPPAALFAIKGAFPEAFRRAAGCWAPGESCRAGEACPCRQTFGQALSPDPEALRRFQKPPLPFVFSFPARAARPGEPLELGLTLVGEAANHLPLYLAALRELFALPALRRRLPCRLRTILSCDAAGTRYELLTAAGQIHPDRVVLIPAGDLIVAPPAVDEVRVRLQTPLRLMRDGRPLQEVEPAVLCGALFRRISSLAYYYNGICLAQDFKELAAQSRELRLVTPRCHWADWGGGVQGLLGSFGLAGELAELLPFLQLGELLQVGKGSAYGMGDYSLTFS